MKPNLQVDHNFYVYGDPILIVTETRSQESFLCLLCETISLIMFPYHGVSTPPLLLFLFPSSHKVDVNGL